MSYEVRDQNGENPKPLGLWEAVIAAFHKEIYTAEWEGQTVTIEGWKKSGGTTLINVHIEGV